MKTLRHTACFFADSRFISFHTPGNTVRILRAMCLSVKITFIRTPGMLKNLETAINNASEFDFNVTHFTIQSNHIHLIAETKINKSLERGMRSLTNTIVKLFQKGSIQIERYHLHVLKTPIEVSNALVYIQNNDLKHTGKRLEKYIQQIQPVKTWRLKASTKK